MPFLSQYDICRTVMWEGWKLSKTWFAFQIMRSKRSNSQLNCIPGSLHERRLRLYIYMFPISFLKSSGVLWVRSCAPALSSLMCGLSFIWFPLILTAAQLWSCLIPVQRQQITNFQKWAEAGSSKSYKTTRSFFLLREMYSICNNSSEIKIKTHTSIFPSVDLGELLSSRARALKFR